MCSYEDTQEVVLAMARAKRAMNRHKGKIEDIDDHMLIALAKDELAELREAIDGDNLMHVIEEAADLFNFIMAVSHKKVIQYRGRKNGNT